MLCQIWKCGKYILMMLAHIVQWISVPTNLLFEINRKFNENLWLKSFSKNSYLENHLPTEHYLWVITMLSVNVLFRQIYLCNSLQRDICFLYILLELNSDDLQGQQVSDIWWLRWEWTLIACLEEDCWITLVNILVFYGNGRVSKWLSSQNNKNKSFAWKSPWSFVLIGSVDSQALWNKLL